MTFRTTTQNSRTGNPANAFVNVPNFAQKEITPMKKLIIKLALRATLLAPLAAYGQSTTTPPSTPPSEAGPGIVDPGHPRVNEVNAREENQQDRIAQGIKNGTLSPTESANLEKGEARIEKQEANDMSKDNGHLTKQEQGQLNREENRLSGRIYRDKHDAQPGSKAPGAGPGVVDPGHPRVNEVNHREENQQDRIAQGVKSGALTPGETSRLEKGEARLQNRESKDMSKDDGHLTKQDKEQLNHEENRLSRRIHRDKHNEHEGKK
jgi:hypothetical protein